MNPVTVEDLLEYQFLSEVSSNGSDSAAVIVTQADLDHNAYRKDLWLIHGENAPVPLTSDGNADSFIWDGTDTILLKVKECTASTAVVGDKSCFLRIHIGSGACENAFILPVKGASLTRIAPSRYLVSALTDANLPDYYRMTSEERTAVEEERSVSTGWYVFDELPFWENGSGIISKMRHRLFLYEETANQMIPLTDPFLDTAASAVSRDGKHILICGEHFTDKRVKRASFYLYSVETGACRCIDDSGRYFVQNAVAAGNGFIVVGSPFERYGLEENYCLYYVDPAAGTISLLADADIYINNSVICDCRYGKCSNLRGNEDGAFFITTQATTSQLYKVSLSGTIVPVVTREGCVDDFDLQGDDIVLTGLYDMQPEEIYRYSLSTGSMRQISSFNSAALSGRYIAKPEHVSFRSHGLDIDGWVLYPKDYDPSGTWPGLLTIHGGPRMTFAPVFNHEMQVFANAGYFVFFCNPWGSSGRGNEFGDLRGRYGIPDYEDLMRFTDTVLDSFPQIDRSRIAVTGGSYGGFMTNWIVGHTDRFRVAVTQRSISNWVSFCGYSDIGPYFGLDQTAATLYDGVERMWEHSPLKYADRVTTPTLFLHSDEDYRCGLPEGIQFYTALKNRGVPARFCLFRGENHDLSRTGKPRNRIKRLQEMLDWIRKYTAD